MKRTTSKAKPPPYPNPPPPCDMDLPPSIVRYKVFLLSYNAIFYNQAAPTMTNRMKRTTIKAKPPPYPNPPPMITPPLLGCYHILFKHSVVRIGAYLVFLYFLKTSLDEISFSISLYPMLYSPEWLV